MSDFERRHPACDVYVTQRGNPCGLYLGARTDIVWFERSEVFWLAEQLRQYIAETTVPDGRTWDESDLPKEGDE